MQDLTHDYRRDKSRPGRTLSYSRGTLVIDERIFELAALVGRMCLCMRCLACACARQQFEGRLEAAGQEEEQNAPNG